MENTVFILMVILFNFHSHLGYLYKKLIIFLKLIFIFNYLFDI